MLLTLNDHCLHEICNNLNLQDHLMLADVCEQLQSFVQNRFETAQKLMKNCKKNDIYWDIFRARIPDNCPKLLFNLKYKSHGEIKCDALKLFCMKDSLSSLKFCEITSLQICGGELKTPEEKDELEQLITSLFPYIDKLHSSISFSGKYIAKLNRLTEVNIETAKINKNLVGNLKELELARLSFTKPSDDWQNLAQLKGLDRLEELKISEEDYRRLCELPDFKLPSSLTKLIVTATADETELKFDENSACYAHIDSVNFSIVITLEEFSYSSVENIMTALKRLVFVHDDINTLRQLYKTHPKDWKQVERIFYFNDMRDTQDNSLLQEKMLEMVRPIFQDDDCLGLNPKQRVAIVLLSQTRPKRFVVRCRNILSELIELPYVPKYLEIRMVFKTQLKTEQPIHSTIGHKSAEQ